MSAVEAADVDVRSYLEHGYLVVPKLLSRDDVDRLNAEIPRFARGEYPVSNPEALRSGRTDEESLANLLAVHFPHWVNDTFLQYLRHPAIAAVLCRIVGAHLHGWDGRVKAMQSMLFVKPPGLPGQAWHQDEHFIPTRDRSLCGAWIALDDATVDNGCLWVLPGSHTTGVLHPTRPHGRPERYDGAPEAFDATDPTFPGFDSVDVAPVPVPVAAGDVVFFNGHLLHKSLPNTTTSSYRRAVVYHYCNAWSQLPWQVPGIARTEDFRVVVPVCGDDPYAWKGYGTTPATVFVRPSSIDDSRVDIEAINTLGRLPVIDQRGAS